MRIETSCTECTKPVVITEKSKTDMFRRCGRAYCSTTCRDAWVSRSHSKHMAETNRKHASERMREKNPMRDPVAKARMRTSLRARGWKPSVQRGNGAGPTAPQQLLACALGWPMELPIITGKRKGSGFPTVLKVDIGNVALKIAIEVDGNSHRAAEKREEDARKDALLRGLGWTVLRFSNREVTERLAACVQTVLSITSK